MSYRFAHALTVIAPSPDDLLLQQLTLGMLLLLAAFGWTRFLPTARSRVSQLPALGLLALIQLQILANLGGFCHVR